MSVTILTSPARPGINRIALGLNRIPLGRQVSSLPKESENIIVVSIPQSGTHLVGKIVDKINEKANRHFWQGCKQYTTVDQNEITDFITQKKSHYSTHAFCNSHNYELVEKNKLKVIVMIRDPRDIIVSRAFWWRKHSDIFVHYANLSVDEAITSLIKSYIVPGPTGENHETLKEYYDSYLSWSAYPNHLITKFEDLIGAHGGGNAITQQDEIVRIAKFMNLPHTTLEAQSISSQIFGKGDTFRKGKIGSWKEYFTPEQKQLFKEVAGDLLIELGYEKDNNW